MIILNATTKTIQVLLGGAVTTNELVVNAEYVDISTTTFAVTAIGSSDTLTTGATAVTAVAAPASGASRQVKALFIYNADTVSQDVTVRVNNNTALRPLVTKTVATLQTLAYEDGTGWYTFS